MENKTCLIYQPLGLGDIIWVQPILDVIIADGYTVYYPVSDVYYDIVSQYIIKNNLVWKKESENFPLKDHYKDINIFQTNNQLYLPLSYADRYFPECSVMISKYYLLSIPIEDYRKHFEIFRNYEREKKLIDTYQLHSNYVLVNKSFGTESKIRNIQLDTDPSIKIHTMSIDQDKKNGFHIFDWIGALENALEIHTVETSLCYLIDKYCNNKLHMYEKRTQEESNTYYRNVALVYRNPNWIYEN